MIVYIVIGIIYAIIGIVASFNYYAQNYKYNCEKYHDISDYLKYNYKFFDLVIMTLFWPVAVIITIASSFEFLVALYIKKFGGKK